MKQKLVRTNPANGAKNYYVGSHAKAIDGWGETESRALLDDLNHPALLMADCIASLGCDRFEMDAWGVDVTARNAGLQYRLLLTGSR